MEINQIYQEIESVIVQSRKIVSRKINSTIILMYWEIGKLIVEYEQKGELKSVYGEKTLEALSKKLTLTFSKGFDESNLRNMRAFYICFQIRDTLRHELSWSHYRLLIRLKSEEKINYYINESIKSNWSSRELQRNINLMTFERGVSVRKDSTDENYFPIKDPYVFDFLGISQDYRINERDLEDQLITNVQKFLLEIGRGFAFVERQQHIVTETSDFYIDLVFYNYILKCFVLIELKTESLKPQDIGQLDMYVRMYDDIKKSNEDNPTIGLLLCTDKDETIVKYSALNDSSNLFASKYLVYLPKAEEIKELINSTNYQKRISKNLEE